MAVTVTSAQRPEWASPKELTKHYNKHHQAVGAKDEKAYDRSARRTIQVGEPFTYTWKEQPRLGYFEPRTGKFTALMRDRSLILTHYVETLEGVRNFPDSTYPGASGGR